MCWTAPRTSSAIPREDLATVCAELERYQPDLLERPALVFLNKTDADPDTAEIIRPDLEAEGWEVLAGSAVTGEGLDALRHRMAALVRLVREERAAADAEDELVARPVLRPAAESDDDRGRSARARAGGSGRRASSAGSS